MEDTPIQQRLQAASIDAQSSIIPVQDAHGTTKNTSAISDVSRVKADSWDRFPVNAQRYLFHLRQHWKKPHDIEQHEIEEWRMDPEFCAFEDSLRSKEAAIVMSKARLYERLPEVANAIVERALNPHDKQSQRAAETVLEANGMLGGRGAGTSVTVNVDASARAWSQSQEQ